MTNSLNEADQLAFIRRELSVARGDGPAEEREGAVALMKNGAKAGPRRVALDDEVAVEVRELQNGCLRESSLQSSERPLGVLVPMEPLLLEQRREDSSDVAVVADEATVVSGQAEESPHRASGGRHRPRQDGIHLLLVYGDAMF